MSEEEMVKPDLLAEEPRKRKAPITGLLLMLIGVGLILLITVIRILDIATLAQADGILQDLELPVPALNDFMQNFGDYIGYGVAIVAFIIVIIFSIKGTRPKVAPIAKYAGLIVLTFAFSAGLMGLLGGFDGLLGFNIWSMLLSASYSTFPGFRVLIASSLLSVPLCFNRKKTRLLSILTLVGVGFYIFLMATITIGSPYNFFDIAWAIFIGGAFAGFFYKSLLAIPAQERSDMDARVLGPMKEAYKKVLVAKAVLEKKPIKIVTKIETPEGVKEEVKQEVPQGNPEELLNEAIRLYSETEENATEHGKIYEREVVKCQIWKQRVSRLLEEQKLVATKKMPETEYRKRWLYIF